MLQAKLEAKFHEQTGENHCDISLPSHHSFWIPPSALFAKHPHSPLLVSNFWAVKFYINNKTTKFPTPPHWDFFLFQLVKILPRNSKSWVISSFYRSCRVIGYMRYLQLFNWQGRKGLFVMILNFSDTLQAHCSECSVYSWTSLYSVQ